MVSCDLHTCTHSDIRTHVQIKPSLLAAFLCCNRNKHAVFTKTCVTAGISFYLLHETSAIPESFSVCQSANSNQSVRVISVSSQYPHVCQPVCLSPSLCLCANLHSQASQTACLSRTQPFCRRMISGSYFIQTCISIGVHAVDSTNKAVPWKY